MADPTETIEQLAVRLVNEHPAIVRLRRWEAEAALHEADPTWREPALAPPPPPTEAERIKGLAQETEWRRVAAEAGVLPAAVPDFIARARQGLAKAESPDPTRQATAREFAERLKTDAPHLFPRKAKPGNGHAVDPW